MQKLIIGIAIVMSGVLNAAEPRPIEEFQPKAPYGDVPLYIMTEEGVVSEAEIAHQQALEARKGSGNIQMQQAQKAQAQASQAASVSGIMAQDVIASYASNKITLSQAAEQILLSFKEAFARFSNDTTGFIANVSAVINMPVLAGALRNDIRTSNASNLREANKRLGSLNQQIASLTTATNDLDTARLQEKVLKKIPDQSLIEGYDQQIRDNNNKLTTMRNQRDALMSDIRMYNAIDQAFRTAGQNVSGSDEI